MRRAVLAGTVLALVAVAALVVRGRNGDEVSIDLVDRLPGADVRTTQGDGASGITVREVTIGGQTRRAILARPYSRITYTLDVPRRAALEAAFAVAATGAGSGAQFRIGISDGRTYDDLLREHVAAAGVDGAWRTARIALSAYAGRSVTLSFNTDPDQEVGAGAEAAEALWADLRVLAGGVPPAAAH